MSPSPTPMPPSTEPAPLWNLLVFTDEAQFLQGLREFLPSETVRLDRVLTPADGIARLRDEVFQLLVVSTARLGAKERDFLREAMAVVEDLQVFLFVDQWDQEQRTRP